MGKGKPAPKPADTTTAKIEIVDITLAYATDGFMHQLAKISQIPPRVLKVGECTVFVDKIRDCHHLSISHRRRYPTWDEIVAARYEAMPPDIMVVQVLPPITNYLNVHPYTFQLWQIPDEAGAIITDRTEGMGMGPTALNHQSKLARFYGR